MSTVASSECLEDVGSDGARPSGREVGHGRRRRFADDGLARRNVHRRVPVRITAVRKATARPALLLVHGVIG